MKKIYTIEAFWDEEVGVWVAQSEDIFGLVTEAETIDILSEKVKVIIPELLILNQEIKNKNTQVKWDLITHHQESLQKAS